jgi:hypothetical protein
MINEKRYKNSSAEEVLGESSQSIVLSPWLKWPLVVFFAMISSVCFFVYWQYINSPKISASPSELGLSAITIFTLSGTVILLLPWNKFGLRIKKIGIFEFEQVVAAQAAENNEVLGYLEERIEYLEDEIRQTVGSHMLSEMLNETKLSDLLKTFFSKHSNTPISALRIRTWGASQPGFEKLSEYNHGFVRHVLRKLVSDGILNTKISKNGNTLYQLIQE